MKLKQWSIIRSQSELFSSLSRVGSENMSIFWVGGLESEGNRKCLWVGGCLPYLYISTSRWTMCAYPPMIRLSWFSHVTKLSYTRPTYQCHSQVHFQIYSISFLASCGTYIPARSYYVQWGERERERDVLCQLNVPTVECHTRYTWEPSLPLLAERRGPNYNLRLTA